MARTTYYFEQDADGNFKAVERRPERTEVNAPHVIPDSMDALKHHGDGKIYTSKRKFAKTTRALDLVEYGNEMPPGPKPYTGEGVKQDIIEAVNYLESKSA